MATAPVWAPILQSNQFEATVSHSLHPERSDGSIDVHQYRSGPQALKSDLHKRRPVLHLPLIKMAFFSENRDCSSTDLHQIKGIVGLYCDESDATLWPFPFYAAACLP